MRGRKPTPTALKLLKGNPGHRPPPPDEPKPPPDIPRCPRSLNKEAKAEWRRITKELDALGMIGIIDKAVLASDCQAWAHWVDACERLEKTGMVIRSSEKVTIKPDGTEIRSMGAPMINPYQKIATTENAKMMKALIEMGMSPSSRPRVKTTEKKPTEPSKKERFFK